jgi:hypothetical protein
MKFPGRQQQVSAEAEHKYRADTDLAGQRDKLRAAAADAEGRFRRAQDQRAPVAALHALAEELDAALTAAMQAAFAARRVEIGPRGYDDRIFRRKAMAKPNVHALTAEAEHLLTLREDHRLNGIPAVPLEPAV